MVGAARPRSPSPWDFKRRGTQIWLSTTGIQPKATKTLANMAVATAIAAMHLTKTLHPPGGATALIAVIGGDKVHALGFVYAAAPVGLGALLMLVIALLINNIPDTRRYPEVWF